MIRPFHDQIQHLVFMQVFIEEACLCSHLTVLPSYKMISKRGQGETGISLLLSKTNLLSLLLKLYHVTHVDFSKSCLEQPAEGPTLTTQVTKGF